MHNSKFILVYLHVRIPRDTGAAVVVQRGVYGHIIAVCPVAPPVDEKGPMIGVVVVVRVGDFVK